MKKFILSLAIIATSFGAFAMQTPAAVKKSEVKTEKKAAPKAKKEVKKEVKEVKKTMPKKG